LDGVALSSSKAGLRYLVIDWRASREFARSCGNPGVVRIAIRGGEILAVGVQVTGYIPEHPGFSPILEQVADVCLVADLCRERRKRFGLCR